VTAAVLVMLNGLWDTLPLLFALLLHEAGHAAACACLRVPIRFFRTSPIGAVIGYDPSSISYFAEAVIAAAGPAVGLVSAALLLPFPAGRGTVLFGCASLGLSLLNLLPISRLDGGVLLRALLCCIGPPQRWDPLLAALSAAFTVLLWICAVSLQLRCGGNLSLLLLSVCMLTSLSAA